MRVCSRRYSVFFHILASFFDKGGLSNCVRYFVKASNFRVLLELFKQPQNFDISGCASEYIVFFHFLGSFFNKGGLSSLVP